MARERSAPPRSRRAQEALAELPLTPRRDEPRGQSTSIALSNAQQWIGDPASCHEALAVLTYAVLLTATVCTTDVLWYSASTDEG